MTLDCYVQCHGDTGSSLVTTSDAFSTQEVIICYPKFMTVALITCLRYLNLIEVCPFYPVNCFIHRAPEAVMLANDYLRVHKNSHKSKHIKSGCVWKQGVQMWASRLRTSDRDPQMRARCIWCSKFESADLHSPLPHYTFVLLLSQ